MDAHRQRLMHLKLPRRINLENANLGTDPCELQTLFDALRYMPN